MSKRNRGYKPSSTTREKAPRFEAVDGNVQVLCPFCELTHPIYPEKVSACGTILRVSAVQTVYPARMTKKAEVVCVRCGNSGGEMVRFGRGFVHVEDCNPQRKLLAEQPTYSELAKRVYNMPKRLRGLVQWFIRRPIIEVNEVDELGKETGKVLGYYFGALDGRSARQRKHTPVDPGSPLP